jgi:DNA transposition AAA+ family ATPase
MDKSIQEGLEQDARRVQERMPDKMTKQVILDVRLRLQEFLARPGWSQKKVGQAVGFRDGSVISSFLKSNYKGDVEGLVKKLHRLMESNARRERRPHKKEFIQTAVAKQILAVIEETEAFSDEQEGKIGLIIGDSGHGKSRCLRHYANVNQNSIYVELDDGMTSTMMFAEIAKKLHLNDSGSRAAITRRLIEALQNRHIIIMLDETSLLSARELNLLRQIIVVKSRCPLILAGNRQLVNTVMQPTTKQGGESLDQFTSRLMCILDLDAMADNKDGGLYTTEDIRKLYEYGGIRLTRDAVQMLRKITKTPRSGRQWTCSIIIVACHLSKKVQKAGRIDSIFIISAIKQLRLPVKERLPVVIEEVSEEEQEKKPAAAKAG